MNAAPTLGSAATPTSGPPAFHLLAKPTGATCNLDCAYCFFLSKEMLYPGSRFRMADELLETYIRQLIEAHRTPYVTIAWQGGEPTLMGVDFFRRSIEYVERYRRPGMTVEYTIQTNGTLIDDDCAAFFKANDFLVGISIDGPPAMHDAYRVDRGGAPTSDRVLEGSSPQAARRRVQRADHAPPRQRRPPASRSIASCATSSARASCSSSRSSSACPRRPSTCRSTQLELSPGLAQKAPWQSWRDRPLYRQEGSLVTDRSVTAEQYGSFLIGVFEEWVRRDIGDGLRPDVRRGAGQLARRAAHACASTPRPAARALAMEHNGDLYSCDHFVEEGYKLGNITETPMAELVASPQQRAFGLAKRDTLPRYCLECDVRFACHGGCPKDRFIRTPDGEPGLNYLCAGYKAFFHHIDEPMRAMSALLRQGRAPVGADGRVRGA